MTHTIDQFGKGDLSARVISQRRDEIGGLARSFNAMAERLQTLVVSERQLLEDISHELRSPLTRLNFAVRLARTAPEPSAALDRVQREVERITSLVSQIVELTRIEGDPLAHRTEVVPIGEIISETVSDCRLEAEIRGCSIHLEGQLSAEVSGDRELIRRALENVLRNAIRYSPQKTAVDVVIGQNGRSATITIRDYGPGVATQALPHIFKPFFRAEEARDAESGGVGLGLSIAQRAVKLHRGNITAENANPGLRVQIALPVISDIELVPFS
jgi:signal transduction histidine kinase